MLLEISDYPAMCVRDQRPLLLHNFKGNPLDFIIFFFHIKQWMTAVFGKVLGGTSVLFVEHL